MEDRNGGIDFVELLGSDISIKIFQRLENPSDLARVSAVSTSWRRIVVLNSLCKQLCLSMFPLLSSVSSVETFIAIDDDLMREHVVYAFLARGLTSPKRQNLVSDAVCASSTDHSYENIGNTLLPGDRVGRTPSYWSSEGTSSSEVPETLLYKLVSKLCVVTEIHVQPHQGLGPASNYQGAFGNKKGQHGTAQTVLGWRQAQNLLCLCPTVLSRVAYQTHTYGIIVEFGCPIYSAKAVQFRLGCLKYVSPREPIKITKNKAAFLDNFVWTYTSPVFPMVQRKGLQVFTLPEPVLCIGGFMVIELFGRNVKHPLDNMFYLCVSYVQALGKNLHPVFGVDILDDSGRCTLTYNPLGFDAVLLPDSAPASGSRSR